MYPPGRGASGRGRHPFQAEIGPFFLMASLGYDYRAGQGF